VFIKAVIMFIKAVIIMMMRTRWWCARLVCGFLFILSATLNSWVEPSQLSAARMDTMQDPKRLVF